MNKLCLFQVTKLASEQDDKTQSSYGRASTMWPRTIELLDQLDLAEALIQAGMITRSGLHFHE